jgi:hypothetical protein
MVLGFRENNVACDHGVNLLYWQYMPMATLGQLILISGDKRGRDAAYI